METEFVYLLSDETYADALAKTLTTVSSPATVGLYCSCQDRLNLILEHMEEIMDNKDEKTEQAEGCKCRPKNSGICGFFMFLFRIFFYRPEWTKNNLDKNKLRLIFVDFSAWHFAGSDLLWAGIAMRLFEAIQSSYGKMKIALFRTTQVDEMEEVKKKTQDPEQPSNRWVPKEILCFPLWMIFLALILIPIFFLIILMTVDFPEGEVKPNNTTKEEESDEEYAVVGMLAASLGIPAVFMTKFGFKVGKNMVFNQVGNIRRAMDNSRLSSKLGFMNHVRKEIWLLSRFIQFMEVFEGSRIRIVLKITTLEHCKSEKIVSVLDAMNILLSDKESPFISILAVDPQVLLDKINFSNGRYTKQDRAYALLNRILTLTFTVPVLDEKSRADFFNSVKEDQISEELGNLENKEDHSNNRKSKTSICCCLSSSDLPYSNNRESEIPLKRKENNSKVTEEEVKTLFSDIIHFTKTQLSQYMDDNAIFMKRVISSTSVSVRIMKRLDRELPNPKNIGAWLVLANQWPCRLSWIIQIIEDKNQTAGAGTPTDKSIQLWNVFNECRDELYAMRSQITDLLEQDGDPEMFEKMLGEKEFGFTIGNLEIIQSVLVNLDQSIKRELAQIRSTTRLKNSGWKSSPQLPLERTSNMTKEKICEEMKKLNFDEKYAEIVRSNNINGSALVFGDVKDLKALLGMNFGEWSAFKLHFLRVSTEKLP
uniref:NTPase, KAP family P-loop domain containing 1 n=1 Tax=Oryzias melastigma TaxID=30732 RepID=A0A3B3DPA0_ORYME